MKFVLENLNPRNRKTGDCVIRAIAKAESKSWVEVFDSLSVIARELYSTTGQTDVISKYLKNYKKIDVKYVDSLGNKKRYTVADVCEFKGTYIVSVASHLTCVKDGVLYDTWNCGRKSAYIIWKIN
jgi:hypothetical protein